MRAEDFWNGIASPELRRMATGGNRNAQAELAWRHASGDRVEQNPAAALGHAQRRSELPVGRGGAGLAALSRLRRAPRLGGGGGPVCSCRGAVQGEVDACFELAMLYFRGEGVRRSMRLSVKWLRAAARLGHAGSRAFLERMERGERLD